MSLRKVAHQSRRRISAYYEFSNFGKRDIDVWRTNSILVSGSVDRGGAIEERGSAWKLERVIGGGGGRVSVESDTWAGARWVRRNGQNVLEDTIHTKDPDSRVYTAM